MIEKLDNGGPNMQNRKMNLLHTLSHIILTVLIISQIILTFFLYNRAGIEIIRNIGWIILFMSAIFGWLPIFEFRRKGGVSKGQSFVKTTVFVDSGIYAIVRHPQFLGGIFLGLALILIAQNWLVAFIGIPVMIIFYLGIVEGDKYGIEKFGDVYKRYMEKVPRANFLLGIIRVLRRKVIS